MNIIKRYFTPNENAAPYDRAWLRTKGALWSFNAFWALWFAVHIIVGTGSIVLPGLAAMSLTGHSIGGSDINILAGAACDIGGNISIPPPSPTGNHIRGSVHGGVAGIGVTGNKRDFARRGRQAHRKGNGDRKSKLCRSLAQVVR